MPSEEIMIVDDNALNLKLAQVVLTSAGYAVHTAIDAEEALKLLGKIHPRLILMDLQLPGMDGMELTRRLKADTATRDIVIIAVTAYAMKGDEQRAREAGCDGYVSKPIDTRTLAGVVGQFMARCAAPAPVPASGGGA